MYNLTISDINGNIIDTNNEYPFIMIQCNFPQFFLEEIHTGSCLKESFWKFNMDIISLYLEEYGLEDKYTPLGHIWFPAKKITRTVSLLLVHKKHSTKPIGYEKVKKVDNMWLWKPIASVGYTHLALVASKTRPNINQSRVVNTKLTKKIAKYGPDRNGRCAMNKYNYLGHRDLVNWSIKQTKKAIPTHTIDGEIRVFDSSSYTTCSTDTDSTISWITPKGKLLKLVQPDEPWYIKKGINRKLKRKRRIPKIIHADTISEVIESFDDVEQSYPFKKIVLSISCFIFVILAIGWLIDRKNN